MVDSEMKRTEEDASRVDEDENNWQSGLSSTKLGDWWG